MRRRNRTPEQITRSRNEERPTEQNTMEQNQETLTTGEIGEYPHLEDVYHRIKFQAVNARGKNGGQNVNKNKTAVIMQVNIQDFDQDTQEKINELRQMGINVSKQGNISIRAQQFKSQKQNKRMALKRLNDAIEEVRREKEERIPTKPTQSSRVRRTKQKQRHSRKKTGKKKRF